MFLTCGPIVVRAATMTMERKQPIIAYSMAVAPELSPTKDRAASAAADSLRPAWEIRPGARSAHVAPRRRQALHGVKVDPRLKKILGYGLIGSGALTVMSGVVNILAARQLIDDAEAASLGVTRNEFVYTYAGFVLAGAVMIAFGWRLKK